MKKNYIIFLTGLILVLTACGQADEQQGKSSMYETEEIAGKEEQNMEAEENMANSEIDSESTQYVVRPAKEEVFAMREKVLEGMTEEEISRLTENIKVANEQMESAYLYDSLFERLEDKDSLYWNYFDQKGDIQIDWAYDGSYKDMKSVMQEENISKQEFFSQYGTPVTIYNRFDANNFIDLMDEMKATVKNKELKDDLQRIIDETKLAKETHEMEHANNVYKLLHDMDYYLLRYGLEDVGKYVKDNSTVSKYYDMLSVYK